MKYKFVSLFAPLFARIFVFIFLPLFVFLFALLFAPSVQAADFQSVYNVEYYIQDKDPQGYTKTAYTIAITNLQPDLIIKKFTLSFPKSFGVGGMNAKDDNGAITASTLEKERSIEVTFELSNPKAGLNEVNTLYLDFLQKNIFREKGTIWELFIPTLENREGDSHSITVYLPPGQHKKLSLAKPAPSTVSLDRVVWNGDVGRSIYAVFGDEQRYDLNLTYHLTNPNSYKVYTDIAFPPDTMYQKIVVESIIPPPNEVFSDSDGNFMGRYNLNGNQEIQVQFKGNASIYTVPRSEYKAYGKDQFSAQQKSLFNSQPLWKLNSDTPVTSSNIKDHYDYTIKTLTYNFSRIIKGNSRMGAGEAIKYPDQAVCTEFSDLLIASARQRGIYIREVQGFAFANEQELRPIQQESDILHSWVEYYNTSKNMWIPVDPTWEDTSGIDYYNSFDFNHIVFALHGKKADYPYPAGSYKSMSGGRDVRIEPTTKILVEQKKLTGTLSKVPLPDSGDSFIINASIKNSGNVTLLQIPLAIKTDNATVDYPNSSIAQLLPGEVKKISIRFTPKKSLFYQDVTFTILTDGSEVVQQIIQVPTILSSLKIYLLPVLLVVGGTTLFLFIFRRKNSDNN